jgi:hypothetical protein
MWRNTKTKSPLTPLFQRGDKYSALPKWLTVLIPPPFFFEKGGTDDIYKNQFGTNHSQPIAKNLKVESYVWNLCARLAVIPRSKPQLTTVQIAFILAFVKLQTHAILRA